jgi:hypothetical protein
VWPGPGRPDQGLPGQPPGFWGGVAPPHPDQGLPGEQPGLWPGQGHPSQPISGGGYILGWSPTYGWIFIPLGGANAPGGGGGGGEQPTHPIAPGGEKPAHPISGGGEKPTQPIQPTPQPKQFGG